MHGHNSLLESKTRHLLIFLFWEKYVIIVLCGEHVIVFVLCHVNVVMCQYDIVSCVGVVM